jgi:hypothetical protein
MDYEGANTGFEQNGNAPVENWQDFSVTFTIPIDATGYYVSFQIYRNPNNPSFAGYLMLKDFSLTEYSFSGAFDENGFKLWSHSSRATEDLIFEINSNGGKIGGFDIQNGNLYSNAFSENEQVKGTSIQLTGRSRWMGDFLEL